MIRKDENTMSDITTLSSHKYIYEIYMDSIGTLVCEKFPIAYINKSYCYFISPGTDELTKVPIGSIYDSIDELYNKKNDTGVPNYLRWFRWTGYFWNSLDMSKYGTQIKKELETNKRKEILNNKLENIDSNIRSKNDYIARTKAGIQYAENEIKKMEEERLKILEALKSLESLERGSNE